MSDARPRYDRGSAENEIRHVAGTAVMAPVAVADGAAPVYVLVMEADPLVGAGLSRLLRRVGIDVVEAPDQESAVQTVREAHPDVVILYAAGDKRSGAEAVLRLDEAMPGARVVMLAESVDDPHVLAALGAGACGAILRDAPLHEIVGAIRAAGEGESALSPQIASRLVRQLRVSREASPRADLSARELEVLRLLSRGWDNARIAAALYVARGTVKHHISSIFAKLGVDNRIQAAVAAVRRGLVDP